MKQLQFGRGETFLVIGVGRTGLATTQVLHDRGAQMYAVDEGPQIDDAVTRIEGAGARFVAPSALNEILGKVDCAVLSPGVPLRGALAQSIAAAGVPILGEVEIAYRLCRAPMIAITGTKGKSTTTALTGHVLRGAGRGVRVGGNIGNALIVQAVQAKPGDWVVAEISSFQLETIAEFHPKISAILNISDDHLDRYDSFAEYAQAKYRIFENQTPQDTFVGNLDDEILAQKLHATNTVQAKQEWFSLHAQPHAAMWTRDGWIVMDENETELVQLSELILAGAHNIQNVMAAALCARAAGVEPEAIAASLRTFEPLEHRLQKVAEVAGVMYVDDSKATNPAAAIAALHSFDRPVVVIAGGRSKNSDFTEFGRAIDERAKLAILIGEAAGEIAAAVHRTPVERASTLEGAVGIARAHASAGEMVLLAPACASFDMFGSAEERGERFSAAVRALREPAKL